MIVVDTNVLSEEMGATPDPTVHAWFVSQNPLDLYTSAATEAEIRFGLATMPDGRRKRELAAAASRVLSLFGDRILPFDSAAAREFAAIMADRRRLGRPIQIFDAQIAAIARSRGMSVATRDVDDFADTGITVIDPWSA